MTNHQNHNKNTTVAMIINNTLLIDSAENIEDLLDYKKVD